MSIYSALSYYASEWRNARDEARTRRILGSLPNEVLKDIGWPEVESHRERRFTSTWAGGR